MQKKECSPKEIALKSTFLGPKAENGPWVAEMIDRVFERWFAWRRNLFVGDGSAISAEDQENERFRERRSVFERQLFSLIDRFETEVPKFSPRYIGHMFSEISLPALLGHIVALLHNPNNISDESSRVGVKIEDEAIGFLRKMLGFPGSGRGHFTSGGTVANYEALFRARARCAQWLAVASALEEKRSPSSARGSLFAGSQMGWERFDRLLPEAGDVKSWNFADANPWDTGRRLESLYGVPFLGPVILVPENKHYSWVKGVSVLGLGEEAFWPVALDGTGKLCLEDLGRKLKKAEQCQRPVMMVVSVAGTTELGAFDPVDRVQDLLDKKRLKEGVHIWHHVDAAYGGYFRLLIEEADSVFSPEVIRALSAISRVDSVTLDPHKLGYVPFSSGAFLARNERDYFVKGFNAPYLQYVAHQDRGPFTLEGSRPATGATATWMTAQAVGLNQEGYGRIIRRTLDSKRELFDELEKSGLGIRIAPFCESNILCFTIAERGEPLSKINERIIGVYESLSTRRNGPFFVSKTTLYKKTYDHYFKSFLSLWDPVVDADELSLIRICLMNPFFNSQETAVRYSEEFVRCLRGLLKEIH